MSARLEKAKINRKKLQRSCGIEYPRIIAELEAFICVGYTSDELMVLEEEEDSLCPSIQQRMSVIVADKRGLIDAEDLLDMKPPRDSG